MNTATAKQRLTALIILAFLGFIAVLAMPKQTIAPKPADDSSAPAATITVTGKFVCLPHKDQSGPTTLECASGIQALDGNYYAIDMSGISETGYDYNGTVTVTGHFTPQMALSSDRWYVYDMLGIIQVQEISNT